MIRALLGGSFDPVHVGHVMMVRTIFERGLADQVSVVPAYQSPHKGEPVTPGNHRLHMVELAFTALAGVEILALEIERRGVSFTVDTLEELARRAPEEQLRLIIGSDNIAQFFTWHRPRRILELAELLIFARDDWHGDLPAELQQRAVRVLDFDVPISSTTVRTELACGRWPTELVPASVLAYIIANGLYGISAGPDGDPCREG